MGEMREEDGVFKNACGLNLFVVRIYKEIMVLST